MESLSLCRHVRRYKIVTKVSTLNVKMYVFVTNNNKCEKIGSLQKYITFHI